MRSYAFGVDVGGTTVKLGLFHTDGTLLEKWEIPTRKEEFGRYVLPDITAAVKNKMAERSISMDEVEGLGMGVPGPVDEQGLVHGCVNLGWGERALKAEIQEELPGIQKVAVGNDCSVAALGEMWKGGGRGRKNVVLVPLGTGVGGGIVIGGHMVAGAHGAAGELGHICVEREEEAICTCGKTGCTEQYASATGIVRVANKLLRERSEDSLLRKVDVVTAKDVFDAAKQDDQLALDVVEQAGEHLGLMLSFVASVVDPELFVIGGGVSRAGTILLDAVERYYRKYAFNVCRNTSFALAELGNDAGIYGCVRMILED